MKESDWKIFKIVGVEIVEVRVTDFEVVTGNQRNIEEKKAVKS